MIDNRFYDNNDAICLTEEDDLNYEPYALNIQNAIKQSAKTTEPLIFGIVGKWGEGKSSLMNLIYNGIDSDKLDNQNRIIRYIFNPWRYSSEDTVILEFFKSMIKRLEATNSNTKETRKKIKKYAIAILSGTTFRVSLFKLLNMSYNPKILLETIFQEDSIDSLRESIDKDLGKYEFRMVIFIDEIDRLKKDEISNIFRLVKLTASFKNITFVLAFDDEIVAKAIYKDFGDTIEDGYNYIEKIINIKLPLPKIDTADIYLTLQKRLNNVFQQNDIGIETSNLDSKIDFNSGTSFFYSDIKGIENYIKTPRTLIRLINNFRTSIIMLKGEINYSDLLWLELLKLKHFKIYNYIKQNPYIFINPDTNNDHPLSISILNYLENVDTYIDSDISLETNKDEIKYLIQRLFPYNDPKINQSKDRKFFRSNEKSFAERRICYIYSFDTFFNFHTVGKISNHALDSFIDCAKDNNTNDYVDELEKLRGKASREKLWFNLIKKVELAIDKDKTKLFLVTLNYMAKFDKGTLNSNLNKQRYYLSLFSIIKNHNFDSNDIDEISPILNKLELSEKIHCYSFLQNSSNTKLLELIEEKIIEQTKVTRDYYISIKNEEARFLTRIYTLNNKKEFVNNILNKITTRENLAKFVSTFCYRKNELTNSDYEHIKSLKITKEIADSVKKHFPEILENKLGLDEIPPKLKNIENIKSLLRYYYYYQNSKEEKTN